MPTTIKPARRPRKPTLPKASQPKPYVVDNHAHAAAAVKAKASHVLVHKALLSHYANILHEHKKLGGSVPQTMIDTLRKYANGKDTHALIGGNWFTSAFKKVGNAIGDAAKWTGNAVKDAAVWTGNAAKDTGNFIVNTAGKVVSAVGSAAGKAADVVGSIAEKANDVASKIAPLIQTIAPVVKAIAA